MFIKKAAVCSAVKKYINLFFQFLFSSFQCWYVYIS
nr:MAG TPA: hypothetical protein [Caudoviricetes sp.]